MKLVTKLLFHYLCKEGDENIVDDEKCNEDIEEEKDTLDDEGDGVNNDRECSGMINHIDFIWIITSSNF